MIAAVYVLLISMLTIAAPRVSEAACAWVLWSHTITASPAEPLGGIWDPMTATPDQSTCERFAQKAEKELGPKQVASARELGLKAVISYVCLPDTVDPRGPKAPR